jgi:5-(carboxyamino)imidazole ribonucleotide synthase
LAYQIVQTNQRDGICREVIAPAPALPESIAISAQRMALEIARLAEVSGMLAVELFLMPDGKLVVNELAMRPHNSGHWSIDGAVTSQFENHLRAVLDLPLGSVRPLWPSCVMVNVIGESEAGTNALEHVLAHDPGLKVTLYGKEFRPGRKLGHVTVGDDNPVRASERAWHGAGELSGTIR